jgi:hypothetical protein
MPLSPPEVRWAAVAFSQKIRALRGQYWSPYVRQAVDSIRYKIPTSWSHESA